MISYNTKLIGKPEDLKALHDLLEMHRFVFNEASKQQFPEKNNSIVVLHSKVYKNIRKIRSDIPSQVIIRGEQECLSTYRSIKNSNHKLSKPPEHQHLSMRLDKRLYRKLNTTSLKITTTHKRRVFTFIIYPRLQLLLERYQYKDPTIYERDNILYISFPFENKIINVSARKKALGVDVGMRVPAACSDGRIIIDRKFNADKRRLRHLKDCLKSKASKGSKSAKRHLKKLKHKERNKNKNQTHLIANTILKTDADTIVLENLKSIKVKKNKYQNKNAISQVPLYELRRIITYKAENAGKSVLCVCPSWTSQTDCLTGKREGERRGRRFYAKSGLIYDSDVNAACVIASKSKLPYSQGNLLAGQAVVNRPVVNGCCLQITEM